MTSPGDALTGTSHGLGYRVRVGVSSIHGVKHFFFFFYPPAKQNIVRVGHPPLPALLTAAGVAWPNHLAVLVKKSIAAS